MIKVATKIDYSTKINTKNNIICTFLYNYINQLRDDPDESLQ